VLPHIDESVPVVGICNISETFFEFLNRAEDENARVHLIKGEQYRGDRALVWFGDPKLVFVSFPIPHAQHLFESMGYRNTRYLAPDAPTSWLSLDILREQAMLDAILDYAGVGRTIQLIPYATTPEFLQLVEHLRNNCGLTVLLPETPAPEAVWTRDYIDSKVGYRVLVSRWLPNAEELLPDGIACHTAALAADVAYWYIANGRSCLVKADNGENGIGNKIMSPGDYPSSQAVLQAIKEYPFLDDKWITVEELIPASKVVSPSLEVYVPPVGAGEPYITYLSDQVFLDFGDFCGVLVSRELNERSWAAPLAESGMVIGRRLQEMGYVGLFDLDCVVDDNERVFLLEVNPRRTGGTHVHEFAYFVFGEDYLDQVALLSYDAMKSGDITDFDTLLNVVGDLQYPIMGEKRGVVITITSALEDHEFGCIVVGADGAETLTLQRQLIERIEKASAPVIS
jgi:hypothetical protein